MKWLVSFVSFALLGGITLAGCGGGGGGAPVEIIIDNLDSGAAVVAGNWDSASADNGNGAYGTDFLYSYADQSNVGVVRFTPNIATAGSYRVDIYWSADTDRTSDQPVIVHHAGGDTTYHVNLQQHGHQWFTLGSHTFNAGTGGHIDFTTNTASGYCNADAVRLVSNFNVG